MAPAPARQGVIVTARESIRYITGWYNNSTTDVEQIRKWWTNVNVNKNLVLSKVS